MKKPIKNLSLTLLLLGALISCNESDNVVPENASQVVEEIPQAAIDELHQKIANGDFDKQINGEDERIGDGKSAGTIRFIGNTAIITGAKTGELCPSNLVRGDREFGGGPWINSRATLYAYGTSLWAWVTFTAEETKGDRSMVSLGSSGQWVFIRSIDCSSIAQINSSNYSYTQYRGGNAGGEFGGCHDGHIESHRPTSGALVDWFQIIGDTGGGDISNDSNCDCDAKIENILFKPITITVNH